MNLIVSQLTKPNMIKAGKQYRLIIRYYMLHVNFDLRLVKYWTSLLHVNTGPHSAVGIMSGYGCVSDCRSRGREFDPGPVP